VYPRNEVKGEFCKTHAIFPIPSHESVRLPVINAPRDQLQSAGCDGEEEVDIEQQGNIQEEAKIRRYGVLNKYKQHGMRVEKTYDAVSLTRSPTTRLVQVETRMANSASTAMQRLRIMRREYFPQPPTIALMNRVSRHQ
jgi:hypothetical protein